MWAGSADIFSAAKNHTCRLGINTLMGEALDLLSLFISVYLLYTCTYLSNKTVLAIYFENTYGILLSLVYHSNDR